MSSTLDTVFKIFDGFATKELHLAVWRACMERRWYFGNSSVKSAKDQSKADEMAIIFFWKMDLDGVEPVTQLWENSKAACEEVAGYPLKVARQYANGHTYGLGGRPHKDSIKPGALTLLYYPMPVWRWEWEGETLFFDDQGEVVTGVAPEPNRAVLFDATTLHTGRAPSRYCPGLRVTVAFKLERADL